MGAHHAPAERHDVPVTRDEFDQLLRRVVAGDKLAADELQDLLGRPEFRGIGDLALHVQRLLIALAAGENAMLAEAIRLDLERLRGELCGDGDTALIRLAIDRLLLAWLEASVLDASAIAADKPDLERRREAASRRLERAMRLLHDLRRDGAGCVAKDQEKASRNSRRVTQAA